MATRTPPPPSAPAPSPAVTAELRSIPIALLHESTLNPRKRFSEIALAELEASIRKSGQLTPILARPIQKGEGPAFEIAAGHRRRRAGERAGLTEMLAIVREMDDAEFMEILTIENLQREDVHPLEEAQGFADLIKHAGYDVNRIHERTGKSHRYVYDRLGMLKLVPELQQCFLDDEITTAHAVILARLSTADQKRVLKAHGALFTFANEHPLPGEPELKLHDRRKAMSPRELQRWIDTHVRLDLTDVVLPEIFPTTAATLTQAAATKEKVIHITRDHFVQPEAKDGEQRTYGPSSWTRADGTHGSKTCEHSVIGVVVVGPGRAESFRVCIAKKKCLVHYKDEVKAAEQREKEKTAGVAASPAAMQRDERAEAKRQEESRKFQEEIDRYDAAMPRIRAAVVAKIRKLPAGAKSVLGKYLLEELMGYVDPQAAKLVGPGSTADDLVRYVAYNKIHQEIEYGLGDFEPTAKLLGIDLKKIMAAEAPKPKKAPAKKAAKKSTKKARR